MIVTEVIYSSNIKYRYILKFHYSFLKRIVTFLLAVLMLLSCNVSLNHFDILRLLKQYTHSAGRHNAGFGKHCRHLSQTQTKIYTHTHTPTHTWITTLLGNSFQFVNIKYLRNSSCSQNHSSIVNVYKTFYRQLPSGSHSY